MKIKTKQTRESCPNCKVSPEILYQLDGWDKDDWLCNYCFLSELINSEADYNLIPESVLKTDFKELP